MNFYSENNLRELEILEHLKEIIDPEIAINIVDLGLIYKVTYDPNGLITINMTLSSKSCPMGDIILIQVESVVKSYFPGFKTEINLVWEPAWNRDFITPAGRKKLGY